MAHIVLDEEQSRIVSESQGDVEIRDSSGQPLGYLTHGFTPEEIAEAKRRAKSDGPWHTTAEVLEHLQSLDRA